MNYFSLFSGIGGFELGIEQANIHRCNRETKTSKSASSIESLEARQQDMGELGNNASGNPRPTPICVGFSEIDKYATAIYKKHFPTHKEYGNVTNIKWSNVPDFGLLCAGFPCQSFSIAGKRSGFSDTRGILFLEIARAAQEKHPRLLFLENVKGLLSHDKGRTFGTILNTLDELGYDLQWQVLNSKNFGVPQNRERVFIIGHLRGTSRPQVFPLQESNSDTIPRNKETKKQLADTITAKYGARNARGTHITTTDLTGVTYALDACYHKGDNRPDNKSNRPRILDSGEIRRLMPTECERLQGFPDGWTSGISDTQRYKCLGNAVTVNVISAISKKLLTPCGGYAKIKP